MGAILNITLLLFVSFGLIKSIAAEANPKNGLLKSQAAVRKFAAFANEFEGKNKEERARNAFDALVGRKASKTSKVKKTMMSNGGARSVENRVFFPSASQTGGGDSDKCFQDLVALVQEKHVGPETVDSKFLRRARFDF